MMIKILQGITVGIFVAFSVIGFIVMLYYPDKVFAFGQLVQILFPIYIAEVIPALIGTPLTEAVRNLTAKKESGKSG
jgi:hypothetical protein